MPDNTDIGIYRSKDYEVFKYKLNPLAHGIVDLILTGQTASTLFVSKGVTNNLSYVFGMTDRYNLVAKYGADILGLNQNYWEQRQSTVYKSKLIEHIKEIINA